MSVSPGWRRGVRAAGLAVLGAVMLAALPARAVPPEYFGLHIHHLGKGTNWPEPGPGSLRAWDARVTWADVQPSRDQFDFSRLDLYVQTARQKGVPVLLPLAHSPRWASSCWSASGWSWAHPASWPTVSRGCRWSPWGSAPTVWCRPNC